MSSPTDASARKQLTADAQPSLPIAQTGSDGAMSGASAANPSDHSSEKLPAESPQPVATGVFVTLHGHFYQPPRENPYLEAVERQPSAAPAHDWNERIHRECYRPNAFARILNEKGEIVSLINNFEYLSFNVGPTLMSWLERYDVETYQRILEGDRRSCDRLNGHGNAIAQVYNHIIMPLANLQDKRTQVRWGKADFRARFGRDPEGLWLAETAVDQATLRVLVEEGIRFIILAPSQAQRCRPLPHCDSSHGEWLEVGGGQIDATRPYRCFVDLAGEHTASTHSQAGTWAGGRPYIDIFFYDGPISRDMGFSDVLYQSSVLAERLALAVRGDQRPAQLISVATDGETFGHHKRGTEKTLAYAFAVEFPRRGWQITNFAHYLSLHPPEWEVQLKPVTAWSCSHGVDRWQDNCGCGGDGGTWHQKWRRPLRDALDGLRDQLIPLYTAHAGRLLNDPWQARDEYIQVIHDRSRESVKQFLDRHARHPLSPTEEVDALRLLEMQRYALLMYTSCGWFFEEISRLEGVQILRYAARALELAAEVAPEVTSWQLESEFCQRLAAAPSNLPLFKDGLGVYQLQVESAKIRFEQIAAQYAIGSLFRNEAQGAAHAHQSQLYCYTIQQLDFQLQHMGSLTLAIGQIQMTSDITWESRHLVFAVLHLGGWDFHCCIQPFEGRANYSRLKAELLQSLEKASAAQLIRTIDRLLGSQAYGLQDLLAEERQRIMQLLTQETLSRLNQLYTQVYRDNYGVLMAFHRDQVQVPRELQVAAEVALSHRILTCLQTLDSNPDDSLLTRSHTRLLGDLEAIATESEHLHCQLELPEAQHLLERLILRNLRYLLHHPQLEPLAIHPMERLLAIAERLHLPLSLALAQELYLHESLRQASPQDSPLLWQLAQRLALETSRLGHR